MTGQIADPPSIYYHVVCEGCGRDMPDEQRACYRLDGVVLIDGESWCWYCGCNEKAAVLYKETLEGELEAWA